MSFTSALSDFLPIDALQNAFDRLKNSDFNLEVARRPSPRTLAAFAAATFVWAALRVWAKIRVKSILRALPGPSSPSWFSGNLPEMYDVLNIRWHHEAIKKYGNIFQINGMFGDEQLYITDARAIHQVIVKDIAIFEEPQHLLSVNKAMFGDGLLSTLGDHHRKQRKILNPVFSEKHMRGLLPIFIPIVQKLCSFLDRKTSSGSADVNIYGWANRTSLELIAQGGMGTSLDSLIEGEESELTRLVKEMVPTISRLHVPMQALPLVHPVFSTLPARLKTFLRRHSPFATINTLNRTIDGIEDTSRSILAQRHEKANLEVGIQQGLVSKDILGVLLKAQASATNGDTLPESEIIAEITTLLFTAQDTTSSALSRILHVLCMHPEHQTLLRAELRKARQSASDKDVDCEFGSYDDLLHLPILDATVRETLRLHPPVSWIWRVARAPASLPLRTPVSLNPPSSSSTTSASTIPVAKGQGIVIGIAAAQRDTSVWGADAEEWKPERWLEKKQDGEDDVDEWKTGTVLTDETRYPGIYSGMLTFSGGGRSCIGFKFALLSVKLLLAALVSRYEFGLAEGQDIVWNMNHIAAPTIRGEEKKGAQMTLKVTRVDG